jgi:sigma-B regulation protein RsbU (phosphoserine phosphatase)
LRLILQALALAGAAVGVAGIGWFVMTGSPHAFLPYNTVVAVGGLLVLVTVVLVKPLSDRFLILVDHRVLAVGTLVFAIEALYANLARPLHYWHVPALDSLGFAALLVAFASVAATLIFGNERRLLSIESELETARRIQASILPAGVPDVARARLAATYRPMTAVAGDYYDFCVQDAHHVGILVADVTGHGVPAALVASMIKVAMRSVAGCAQDPGQVLRELNRVLADVLRGQYVTAAYLWLDTDTLRARYSAAGHPPLLHWSAASGELRPIQSNGVLFGVLSDTTYPVQDLWLTAGDRLLLYTDGLIEPEDVIGEPFGDKRLEEVVRAHQASPAGDLSTRLLDELCSWQPNSSSQQDDITLVVIDILL